MQTDRARAHEISGDCQRTPVVQREMQQNRRQQAEAAEAQELDRGTQSRPSGRHRDQQKRTEVPRKGQSCGGESEAAAAQSGACPIPSQQKQEDAEDQGACAVPGHIQERRTMPQHGVTLCCSRIHLRNSHRGGRDRAATPPRAPARRTSLLSYVRSVAVTIGLIAAAPGLGVGREQQERDQYRYYKSHEDDHEPHCPPPPRSAMSGRAQSCRASRCAGGVVPPCKRFRTRIRSTSGTCAAEQSGCR